MDIVNKTLVSVGDDGGGVSGGGVSGGVAGFVNWERRETFWTPCR